MQLEINHKGPEGEEDGQGEELNYCYPPTAEEQGEEKQHTHGYKGDEEGGMFADQDSKLLLFQAIEIRRILRNRY